MFYDNKKSIDDLAHLNKKIQILEQENNALKKKNDQLCIENEGYKNIIRMFDLRDNLAENLSPPYPFSLSKNVDDLEKIKITNNTKKTWSFVI